VADEIIHLDRGEQASPGLNLLKGEVARSDDRFTYFRTRGGEIRCMKSEGAYRAAVIPYSDIILSVHELESSAQNRLKGVVTAVIPEDGGFRVDVDCGFTVSALVTGYSIDALRVVTGADLYVIFKASSVSLY
jgi:molybdopterin-binding protein